MLPILISVPHGGVRQPSELAGRVSLSATELFDDSDAFTGDIYDLGEEVARVVRADIARVFVDLNRAPDDRPPANPDGVVKSTTCYRRPVYLDGAEPDDELVATLLRRYHAPYHERLRHAAADPTVRLALDCHSMAAAAPPVAPDPGRPRPLFCLSNAEGLTCPTVLLEDVARAIADAFGCGLGDVKLNDPFKGGYIIRAHGRGELPWIQVEMNRSLYLDPRWFDRGSLHVEPDRLAELRSRFLVALRNLSICVQPER